MGGGWSVKCYKSGLSITNQLFVCSFCMVGEEGCRNCLPVVCVCMSVCECLMLTNMCGLYMSVYTHI